MSAALSREHRAPGSGDGRVVGELAVADVVDAVEHFLAASRQIGSVEWALRELYKLGERQYAPGREPFQHAIQAALSRGIRLSGAILE
jgi:hypothetical protein